MDPRLLEYYNRELLHVREAAAEFATEFPKIAGRLAIDGIECADPYVERLLEGFAFLTARIQLKLDSEFPNFTQHLLEIVYPDFLAPVPSMAIVRMAPSQGGAGLLDGREVPAQSVLRGQLGTDVQTACEFRTAHPVWLWPISVADAKFLSYVPEQPRDFAAPPGLRGMLRLRLKAEGTTFDKIKADELVFYLSGDDVTAARLHEYILSSQVGVIATAVKKPTRWFHYIEDSVKRVGFRDNEAMLPPSARSFRGYRLLREYSALPQRFLFFQLTGLRAAFARCNSDEIELGVLLRRADNALENVVDASNFTLYATPAVNLFPKQADRIHVTSASAEYHIVPDRSKPMDFEIHSVTSVTGQGSGIDSERPFRALYATIDQADAGGDAYYTVRRAPRVLSEKQKRTGSRTTYVGTELFLSIVETDAAPFSQDLQQLSISTKCSNRDLPLLMPTGSNRGDFVLEASAPVDAVFCMKGPTRPQPPRIDGTLVWRLISHLSLNYLSLSDTSPQEGAAALKEMLGLYGLDEDSPMRKQLNGIQSIAVRPIIRRMPSRGPVTFGRGFEIDLSMEERSFEGSAPFLLASVLEEFFSRHASLNAFTETVLKVAGRGEIMRWPARFGVRPVL